MTVYNDGAGAINFSGSGSVRLTPPADGTYQDITLFQNPASATPINLAGGGDVSVTGTVYAPRAKLNLTGNGGLTAPATAGTIAEYILYDLNVTGIGGVAADASDNQAQSLAVSVSPAPKFLRDGTPVTNAPQSTVSGTTRPGAQVDLETGSDGLFDDGHTTADGSGHYSFSLTLAEGPNVLQVRATSRYGQQVIASANVTLDTAPPTITGSRAPAANADGRNNTDVVVSFSAADNQGLASVTDPVTLSGEGAGQSASGTATDVAGNSASTTVGGINIDKTRPATSATPGGPAGSGGWYRGVVTVTLAATDNLAGVRTTSYTLDNGSAHTYGDPVMVSGDGVHTVHLRGTDQAGNGGAGDVTFTLDTIPPVVPAFDLSSTSMTPGSAAHQTAAARVTLVGHTDPNVPVTLLQTGATALSSNTGAFQFPDVLLALGDNPFTARATDAAGNASSYALTITRTTAPAQPDAVVAWNQALLAAIQLGASDPAHASRALAMVQAAVYDAVSAIDGTPAYYVKIAAPADASAEAAVDAAAYTVLGYLYPAQQANFNALLASRLAALPDGQPKTDGLPVGQAAGSAIVALRAHDGYDTFVDFTPQSGPGQWQPTAPTYAEALDPQWATLAPFAMTSDSQFRPAGPPDLASQQWADAFNEVKSLGSATSTMRTADQTQMARFRADGAGTATPAGHWNVIAEQIAQQQADSLAADARLFAELDIAMGDAALAAWDAKYTYTSWRPITAIQNADQAGNPNVTADPTRQPLLVTPPFPEYISGHSTYSGAAAAVLDSFFGSSVAFTSTSAGFTRSYANFDQAAIEAGRSRVYGGIHFEFSDADGGATGRAVGSYVLQTFQVATDEQPPKVSITAPPSGKVSATNTTISGQVTDNLSGVQKLEVALDGSAYVPLTFGAAGNFSLPTSFALSGSADGARAFLFRAADAAGSVSTPWELDFTLDTRAPAVTVAAPAVTASLAAGARLTGTASGTGSALTALSHAFDNGRAIPLSSDPTSGAFDVALNLTTLAPGAHTLTVRAGDAAGNAAVTNVAVTLPTPPPAAVTDFAPTDGATDVGSTFRPKVTFSAPIDAGTLNANDFYATDTTGKKLPATIVPANDGTYAWLFFTNPMPGASTITITVDGSVIHAAGGAPIDAGRTGTAGGKLTFSFSTVSESFVPGTTITGIVADPGPDLTPNTPDDVKAGPDGVLMTGDGVYLLPIANAKVYVLGHEDQAVYSDATGHFTRTSGPVGDVKLGIDGRTATNAPAGYFFPEMVMDLTIRPGVANTVMGSMGSTDQQAATAAVQGVYLPRVAPSALQTVSATQTTEIGLTPQAATGLTPLQASEPKIDVAPGSLIGMDGKPMATGQVGISTVPPQLVMDMLPAGVLQHTFDITIQAPGVATCAAPAAMTFPNVFHADPGTQLDLLSFDHTAGRLVIDGTATGSADGLTVTTDPGMGITHAGWHGLVAPGSTVDGTGCDGQDVPPGNPVLKVVAPGPNPDSKALPFRKEGDVLQLKTENTGGGVLEVTPVLSDVDKQYFQADNVDSCAESGVITVTALNPENWDHLTGPEVYAATFSIETNGGDQDITLVRVLDAGDTADDGTLQFNTTTVNTTRTMNVTFQGDASDSVTWGSPSGPFAVAGPRWRARGRAFGSPRPGPTMRPGPFRSW